MVNSLFVVKYEKEETNQKHDINIIKIISK